MALQNHTLKLWNSNILHNITFNWLQSFFLHPFTQQHVNIMLCSAKRNIQFNCKHIFRFLQMYHSVSTSNRTGCCRGTKHDTLLVWLISHKVKFSPTNKKLFSRFCLAVAYSCIIGCYGLGITSGSYHPPLIWIDLLIMRAQSS